MRPATVALAAVATLCASAATARQTTAVRMPPEIGTAYGKLGKGITTHDIDAVKSVWAEDFVVNSPDNRVLNRDEVIAAMNQDLLAYRDFKKNIRFVGEKPGMVVVMGFDTMIPLNGPGAGKQVMRPFTDVWAKRGEAWLLVARQATIAALQ